MNRVMGIALAAIAVASGQAGAQAPVKIGLITTLSTPGGYLGQDMRHGSPYAGQCTMN